MRGNWTMRGPTEAESRQGAEAWIDGYKTGVEDGEQTARMAFAAVIMAAGGEVAVPVTVLRELDGDAVIEKSDDPVSDTVIYRVRTDATVPQEAPKTDRLPTATPEHPV